MPDSDPRRPINAESRVGRFLCRSRAVKLNSHVILSLMSSFDQLPRDISNAIVATDPQTWRAMRLVSSHYHQLLSWPAYVNKFTVNKTGHDEGHQGVTRWWFLDGKLHREHDLPALIRDNGTLVWYQYGQMHREHDKPALINFDGTRRWCQWGQLHRDHDRPAMVYTNGTRSWQQHGKLHREHDRPAVIYPSGSYHWYQHDERHRDGYLPAVIHFDGSRDWYQHGERHRDGDRPARIDANGVRSWYRHDRSHRKNGGTRLILQLRPVCRYRRL